MRLSSFSPFLREPLVHFLTLGAVLFLLAEWRGADAGAGSRRIAITPGQIEALSAGFARTWQRPPTAEELKGLVDEFVREEMAYREAVAMGLDRDDAIIRRRLRQKLEFLLEDIAVTTPVTDEDLQRWLEEHPEAFRTDPQITFRQVYLSTERGGAAAERDAVALLADLRRAGPRADITRQGDAVMLPQDVGPAPRYDVARMFGEDFADAVLALDPGQWLGPVPSGYGLHLVVVLERIDGTLPALDAIRPVVEREVQNARRVAQIDAMYEQLLERYAVSISMSDSTP